MLKNNKYHNLFHFWLVSLAILVGLIVIVGGLTRLTNSGLSITEWELFTGILPPLTLESWTAYFDAYKKIPQYLFINIGMNLEEFKFIFLWEYAHRLLARFIGIFFLVPFLFFLIIGFFDKKLTWKLLNIFVLIVIQGAIGWYMVKSGLIENSTVSHYRLSVHLLIAFLIFSSLIWIILNSFNKTNKKFFNHNQSYVSLKFLLFFLFIQIVIGAFVSGLDAGKIYQTWPLMNNNFIPNDVSLNNFFNFNQPSVVQFLHRNTAYLIFFLSIYIGFEIFKEKEFKLYVTFLFYFLAILTQIMLGILVLISGTNIYLASMHQISSIFLILAVLNLYYRSIR
jgi:cytochrome c oxidase assembly protein subunit 15